MSNTSSIGCCELCGKRCYPDRKAARRAARMLHPAAHLSAYRCGPWWHFGNLPREIIRGVATRDSLRPKASR